MKPDGANSWAGTAKTPVHGNTYSGKIDRRFVDDRGLSGGRAHLAESITAAKKADTSSIRQRKFGPPFGFMVLAWILLAS
jgi:hypothetical protein